jgi:YidC/Oxa1 family membrane protein insertase
MFKTLYHHLLYQPLLNLLILFYVFSPGQDIGVAILLLTLLVRLVLHPSFRKQVRSQHELATLQPEINAIRERHKGDQEGQSRALLEFYKTRKVNPFSSCLALILQLLILIPLYQVFITSLNGKPLEGLYAFVPNPGTVDPHFLGLINLANPNLLLAILAGGLQFLQSLSFPTSSGRDMQSRMSHIQMRYVFPAITVLIAARLPAGLALYWGFATLLAIVEQRFILRSKPGAGGTHASTQATAAGR